MEENEIITENGAVQTGDGTAAVKKHGIAAELYDWFDNIFYGLLLVLLVFVLITRTSSVDGDSMVPTLENGQLLLVSDFAYTPAYNDIVVCWTESEYLLNQNGEPGKAIVKRVIGLPGDTISIDYYEGKVFRNGELLPVTFTDEKMTVVENGKEKTVNKIYEDGHLIKDTTRLEEGRGGEFTVPEGSLFVMGDNRNNSTDSRSAIIGFIDRRYVVGRAYLRLFPFNKFGTL